MAVEGVDAMRALPESDRGRRLVVVAVSAADVLDPDSDLRQVAAAANEADVLVARVDVPSATRLSLPADAADYLDEGDHPDDHADASDPPEGTAAAAAVGDLLAGFTAPLPAAGPHLPASLHLHHLDLRWRVQEADEPDLVAALSELVGFDPDDGVFCVAPATGPDAAPDPEQVAVDRAVRRVARVYGLPVLHYRPVAGAAEDGVVAAVPPAV